MLKKLIVALGVTVPVLLAGTVLAATLPNLTPGSQFRYVFLTSGSRNATSTNIANYNTFVNNAASTGSQTSGITGPWTAIASTSAVSARTNTATTGTGGVPIYPLQEIPTIPEPTTIIASLLVGAGLLPLKRRSQKTK